MSATMTPEEMLSVIDLLERRLASSERLRTGLVAQLAASPAPEGWPSEEVLKSLDNIIADVENGWEGPPIIRALYKFREVLAANHSLPPKAGAPK